jgi:hypothetical protein
MQIVYVQGQSEWEEEEEEWGVRSGQEEGLGRRRWVDRGQAFSGWSPCMLCCAQEQGLMVTDWIFILFACLQQEDGAQG